MMMDRKKIVIGLLLLMVVSNIGLAISPSIASIGEAFPEVGRSMLQMILSFAAFASFAASLIAGKLQKIFSQKYVVLFGAILLSLGVLPVFISQSFNFLLATSIVLGFGSGIMTATIPALVSTYFTGDERSSMLGKNTSLKSIGSMAMTACGGVLAVYGWQYNYLIFLAAVIGLIAGFILLPNTPKVAEEVTVTKEISEEDQAGLKFSSMPSITLMLLGVSLTLMSAVNQNNLSLHVSELGIGDASLAGTALSIYSLGSIAAGFIINYVTKLFKQNTLVFGYTMMGVGQFLIFFTTNKWLLFLGCIFVGISMGTTMTRILYLMTSVVRKTDVPVAASLFSAATSLGFSLSPLIFNNIGRLISDNLSQNSYLLASILAFLIIVGLLFSRFESKAINNIVK